MFETLAPTIVSHHVVWPQTFKEFSSNAPCQCWTATNGQQYLNDDNKQACLSSSKILKVPKEKVFLFWQKLFQQNSREMLARSYQRFNKKALNSCRGLTFDLCSLSSGPLLRLHGLNTSMIETGYKPTLKLQQHKGRKNTLLRCYAPSRGQMLYCTAHIFTSKK